MKARSKRLLVVGLACLAGLVGRPQAARAEDPTLAEPPSEATTAADDLASLKAHLERLEQTVAEQSALLEANLSTQVESELDALSDGSVDQKPNSVAVYGFMDFGLQRYISSDNLVTGITPSAGTSFVSGNNNIYFDARPMRGWRALLEIRFALHPHGNITFTGAGPAQRQDSSILDSTSASGRNLVRLGSIIIERSVLEWQYDSRLTIQMGYFLTPWGIWNIDHGTPTLISLIMPSFLLNEAVLRQQIGMGAFGRFPLGDWTLGYHTYLSNGRTPSQFDLDDGKAFGARLTLGRHAATTRTTFGTSFFHGRSVEDQRSLTLMGSAFGVDVRRSVDRTETTGGVDLSFDWKGLRVRAEGVLRRVTHASGLCPRVILSPVATEPNRTEFYTYGLAAYRFGSFEPFVYGEYIDAHKRTDLIDKGWAQSLGLNIYLSTVSQIKLQYVRAEFDSVFGPDIGTQFITSRYVLSF